MYRIVSNPLSLSTREMNEFFRAFQHSRFRLVTSDPTKENVPDLLSATLQNKESYCMILDDRNASFNYFSIGYRTTMGEDVLIPVGAYGISSQRKVLFPLVINGIWQILLMLDKDTFARGCAIPETEDSHHYYGKLIQWKKQFIQQVFQYYSTLVPGYCSAMAWPARGEKSATRSIAESLAFHRIIFAGGGKEIELYSTMALEEGSSLVKYFKNCLFRWEVIGRDELRPAELIDPNLVSLVKSMVEYNY